jgi:hypothetical protein
VNVEVDLGLPATSGLKVFSSAVLGLAEIFEHNTSDGSEPDKTSGPSIEELFGHSGFAGALRPTW